MTLSPLRLSPLLLTLLALGCRSDGRKFSAKRRGLKVTLTLGTLMGDGLMRRLTVSRDPTVMLRAALDEAGVKLQAHVSSDGGRLVLELPDVAPSAPIT